MKSWYIKQSQSKKTAVFQTFPGAWFNPNQASWARACFRQSPVPYVDEEWGSPWAALVAQVSAKLCSFQEARGRLQLGFPKIGTIYIGDVSWKVARCSAADPKIGSLWLAVSYLVIIAFVWADNFDIPIHSEASSNAWTQSWWWEGLGLGSRLWPVKLHKLWCKQLWGMLQTSSKHAVTIL